MKKQEIKKMVTTICTALQEQQENIERLENIWSDTFGTPPHFGQMTDRLYDVIDALWFAIFNDEIARATSRLGVGITNLDWFMYDDEFGKEGLEVDGKEICSIEDFADYMAETYGEDVDKIDAPNKTDFQKQYAEEIGNMCQSFNDSLNKLAKSFAKINDELLNK